MTLPSSTTDGLRSSLIVRGVRGALLLLGALGLYACVAPVDTDESKGEMSSENVGEAEQAVCSIFTGGCRAGQTCCSGACTNVQTDPQNCNSCGHSCGPNSTCSSGVCGCQAGYTMCGGTCVALSTDEANCGSCGNVCGANQVCSSGSCVCAAGYTNCNGSCKNLLTDRFNCGSCGHACHITEFGTNFCEDGGCYYP